MNTLFKKREANFFLLILAIGGLLFLIHTYLNFHFAKDIVLFFPLWHIYIFHLVTVFIIYTLINYLDSIGKTGVFNTFILGMLFKMVLVMLFLLPWILSKPEQKGYDLANFMIPYFIFLTLEVYFVTKLIQKNKNEENLL